MGVPFEPGYREPERIVGVGGHRQHMAARRDGDRVRESPLIKVIAVVGEAALYDLAEAVQQLGPNVVDRAVLLLVSHVGGSRRCRWWREDRIFDLPDKSAAELDHRVKERRSPAAECLASSGDASWWS